MKVSDMTPRYKIHYLREHLKLNSDGQGLGKCYNFGYATTEESKTTCKTCIKRIESERHAKK
jgi:hypothetical protein